MPASGFAYAAWFVPLRLQIRLGQIGVLHIGGQLGIMTQIVVNLGFDVDRIGGVIGRITAILRNGIGHGWLSRQPGISGGIVYLHTGLIVVAIHVKANSLALILHRVRLH